MRYRNLISFLLLLILCVQILPVKEIGSVLFSNQINEELPHACDDAGKDGKIKIPDFKDDLQGSYFLSTIFYNAASVHQYTAYTSVLPHNHSCEIPTPPPDIMVC